MNAPPAPASPWSHAEKTELLCEIIKASRTDPDQLLALVRSLPVPNWDDLVIPRGRTLNQCKSMYHDYVQPPAVPQQPPHQIPYHDPPVQPDFRRFPMLEPHPPMPPAVVVPPPNSSIPGGGPRYHDIQPRPPAHSGMLMSPPPQPERRRRGRPTKVEAERRRQVEQQREALRDHMARAPMMGGPMVAGPSLAATQAAQAVMPPSTQLAPRQQPVQPNESPRAKRKRTRSPGSDVVMSGRGPERALGPGPPPQSTGVQQPPPAPPQPQALPTSRPPPTRGYVELLQSDDHGPSTYRSAR